MNLDDLNARLPAHDRRTVSVDVSRWFGEEEGKPVCFVYRELGLPESWQAFSDAREIRELHPTWPEKLCQIIAALAAGHVEPVGTRPIGLVYCDYAENQEDLFLHLSGEFARAFPGADNLEAAAAQAKNALSTASTEPSSRCASSSSTGTPESAPA